MSENKMTHRVPWPVTKSLRSLFIITFPGLWAAFPACSSFPQGDNSPFHLPAPSLAACLALKMAEHLEPHRYGLNKPSFRAGFAAFDCNPS